MTPIIFDLEWNQPLKGRTPVEGLPDEIIQIGAAKIDLEVQIGMIQDSLIAEKEGGRDNVMLQPGLQSAT